MIQHKNQLFHSFHQVFFPTFLLYGIIAYRIRVIKNENIGNILFILEKALHVEKHIIKSTVHTIPLFYFSGTGNTWWVSQELCQALSARGMEATAYSIEQTSSGWVSPFTDPTLQAFSTIFSARSPTRLPKNPCWDMSPRWLGLAMASTSSTDRF